MTRRSMFGLLGGVGGFLLTGCGLLGGNRYRYKITVDVDTPEGLCTGFAVRQVDWSAGTQITQEATTSSMTHKGEAAIVDLPNGQMLFALMSPDGQETPMLAFGSARQTSSSDRSVKQLSPPTSLGDYRGQAGYPRLVRFKDISDPASVEKVNPADLAASFGVGYRLKGITAQIVDEDVTQKLRGRLGWLSKYPEPRLAQLPPGGTTSPSFAQSLSHGDFIQGL